MNPVGTLSLSLLVVGHQAERPKQCATIPTTRCCCVAAPHSTTSLTVGIGLVLSMGMVLLVLFALVLWLHHRSVDSWMEPEEDDSSNEIR